MSQHAWRLDPPNPQAEENKKKEYLESLKAIHSFILDHKDSEVFKKIDVPDIMSLKEYLNSKIGQVIELKLPDRRSLGIYPDTERLKGQHDVEYHASTVVNIAKLFKLFDASEIIIKEI